MNAGIFLERAIRQVPRVLGFGDRDGTSKTFGSFDRYYWHYKQHDWRNARFQEAAYLLALVYSTPHESNPFAGKKAIGEWARGAAEYWLAMRNGDGSVDELYPHERSFCATAFTALAAIESAKLLGFELKDISRTLDFLGRFDNPDVANQRAAAAAALLAGGRNDAAQKKIALLLKTQDIEGFFPEYGGQDIGYQTITLGLLSNIEKRMKYDGLTDALDKGVRAVEKLIDSHGGYDYHESSRQTQYLYLYSFACLRSEVMNKAAAGLEKNVMLEPGWLDDRYVIPLCIDYMLAYRELAGAGGK